MKEGIFKFAWACILAFLITRLCMWIDTRWLIHERWLFPDMLWWLEAHNIVLRKVFFWLLVVIFTIGDAGKKIGNIILVLIGIAGALLLLVLVIEFCSWLFPWINSLI
jgi:hypothetical protein